jgi:hypothetical protein
MFSVKELTRLRTKMISPQLHRESDIGTKPTCSDGLIIPLAAGTDVKAIAEYCLAAKR